MVITIQFFYKVNFRIVKVFNNCLSAVIEPKKGVGLTNVNKYIKISCEY